MSDAGRTRLEIDNDLAPQQQPGNALVPWSDPEAYGAAQASRAMEPVVGPYLRDVVTGEMAKRSLQERFQPEPAYDPNRPIVEQARERLREPPDLQTAMDLALAFSGGGLQFKAYHGTGAKFNKYDPEMQGTGEGTQLFGPGFYVAGNKEVAKTYVPPGALTLEGKPWLHNPDLPLEHPHNRGSAELIEARGNIDAALESLRDNVRFASKQKDSEFWQNEKTSAENTIKYIEANRDKISMGKGGHLLDVWIKPNHDEFMDWDLKFRDQEPLVQDKIMNHFPWIEAEAKDLTGREIYDALVLRHSSQGIGDEFGDSAAKALDAAGIPGMRYMDAGSRGGKTSESTYNYTVYNPDNLEITHRDGRRLIPVDHIPKFPDKKGQP